METRGKYAILGLVAAACIALIAVGSHQLSARSPATKATTDTDSRSSPKFVSEARSLAEKSLRELKELPSLQDVDRDFANLISVHNQTAVSLAELEKKYGKDPEMLTMAQRIIDGQKADIKILKDWIEKHKNGNPHQ